VSKSSASSPLTNPEIVKVNDGSDAPYTLVCPESAVTVNAAAVILKSDVT
jgi:hypothetical protein